MEELVIETHNFESVKNEIKKFSEETPTDLDLSRVDNSKDAGEVIGDFLLGRGLGLSHKVTGDELNDLTSQVQQHLHSVNDTQIKLIKEFGQVYSALEALDKDYIQAILVSIKATEHTSEGIRAAQKQIRTIVDNQKKTLENLQKFKSKLDGYDHLANIDNIWQQTEAHKNRIHEVEQLCETQTDKLEELVQVNGKILEGIDSNGYEINSLMKYNSRLKSLSHLEDVDDIWESVNEHASLHKDSINKSEKLATSIQKNREEVCEKLENSLQRTNDTFESLNQRIKYAYWIAGGAAGLALVELILLFSKVIL